MVRRFAAAFLALAAAACAPTAPIYQAQTFDAAPEKATVFLDFVADNLPRNLTGQILPLMMVLFEVDPSTGQRTGSPPWSLGVCQSPALGCGSGEVRTLRLELPPGSYGVGYLGSTGFAAPWYFLMDFEDPEIRGGQVFVGGLMATPDFSRQGQATHRTPVITVRAGEFAYAGLLRATYGDKELSTTIAATPERRAQLLAHTGLAPGALIDRPGHYR